MKRLACWRFLLLLVAVLLVAVPALSAQSTGGQTIAVKAGHLIDPVAGTVASNSVIVIQDGKITAAGAGVPVPANAQVIDLSNEWVMPGMVDAHTHITMNVPPSPSGESLWDSYLLKESTGVRTARGVAHSSPVLA